MSDRFGVHKLAEKNVGGETVLEYKRFCSPLAVIAHTRDTDGENWGRLLRIVDRDDIAKTWAMPMELLSGDGTDYRRELLSLGLTIQPGKFARDALHEFISTEQPSQKIRCAPRPGWHGNAYVSFGQTFDSGKSGEKLILQMPSGANHAFRRKGTLEAWQQLIARYAVGNSRLAFAISAAFAAPLLHPTGSESGGFHFRGASSTGKSTALAMAGSVWGGGSINGFLKTWRATSNGIESVAAVHSDALLCLDEMGQVDAREAGAIAYMLANGSGKTRAGRTGEARAAAGWRTIFLSSGEISLAAKMAEEGRGPKAAAGQEVRVVDIPVDGGAGMGVFESLHGFPSGDALSRHLKSAIGVDYGHAAPAFIEHLVRNIDGIAGTVRLKVDEFVRANVVHGADGQVSRVASRFGLVAAAREMAIEHGILPWPAGEGVRAAKLCFATWVESRGGIEPTEIRAAISQVRRFIELHGSSRFENIGAGGTERIINRAGFREMINDAGDFEYLVLPEVWRSEVCQGLDTTFAAKTLADRGMLRRGKDGKPQIMKRLPGASAGSRVYVITPSLMSDTSTNSS